MNDNHPFELDQTDEDILAHDVPDEALEAVAAGPAWTAWTKTFLYSPPLPCC